jgi:hypothetical protein
MTHNVASSPARVGRTLLSDAFDVNFDFDLDREGHGFSRAAKHSVLKGRGFQPRRKVPQKMESGFSR